MSDNDNGEEIGNLGPERKFTGRKGFSSTKKKIKNFQRERRKDAVKKFKKEALSEYEDLIKSIVVCGSVVRDDFSSESDVDVFVFVDDTSKDFKEGIRKKMKSKLKEIAEDCGDTKSGRNILHVQPPWSITEFWDMLRTGSPLAHSITEDGVAVYDTGFFGPMKRMFKMGKLPATTHSAERRLSDVPKRLERAERMKLAIIAKDVYNAMTNSLQAVLVYKGQNPYAPKQLAEKAREHLVKPGLLEEKYIEDYVEIYNFYKGVNNNKIEKITGEELDEKIEIGKEFFQEMSKILKKIKTNRKANGIQKNYEVMIRTTVGVLKALDELPEDPKELPKRFKEVLIDGEMIDPAYGMTFKKVMQMKQALDNKDLSDVGEHEINVAKNYVRRYVRDIRQLLEDEDIEIKKLKQEVDAKEDILKKETSPEKNDAHVCDECDKEFDSERGLKIHKGRVHS